ncbi:ferredoxin, partial [candidate division KSB1 bacterium]
MAYFIDASKCSGCGACLDVCPQGAIYMVNHTAMIDS